MIKIIEVTSNGKLYITGEYNVLNKKGRAVLLGVNRHINFIISEDKTFSYLDNGITEKFSYQNDEVVFTNGNDPLVKVAIEEAFNYLKYLNVEIKPFELKINSELTQNGIKLGLGSSAAIITGTIKSIFKFHEINFDEILVYKIAVITKIKANEYSSGGDLASSLYDGLIYYQRYHLNWVLKHLNSDVLYKKDWPHLKIIPFKSKFEFIAVWTKESYKTVPLTYQISKKEYKRAQKLVIKTYKSLIDNHQYDLKKSLNGYQEWLNNVLSQDELVTPKLRKALDVAQNNRLTAKISGAGGGDSIICLIPKGYYKEAFLKELKDNDLEFLNL